MDDYSDEMRKHFIETAVAGFLTNKLRLTAVAYPCKVSFAACMSPHLTMKSLEGYEAFVKS